jgi:predicted nucleic acid-binding protein
MRFWDSSAIVPLCLDQPLSARARSLYDEDTEMAVWWGTPVECASAFARLRRDGIFDQAGEDAARGLLAALQDAWFEIQPGDALRRQALRVLRIHPLRAAGSLQLAAALEWGGSPPAGELVTFDERLKSAARREGFGVV